jgi:dihydroorotate dehydrogenase
LSLMLYKNLLRPLLFRLDPETAHELAIKSLRVCLSTEAARRFSRSSLHRSPFGKLERFGISFDNPLGLAAGFDKNGTATEELASVGFGFLEIGTVTRYPQPGNPRPRIFRLPEDLALINRAGFNNAGAEELAAKLTRSRPDCILGINIGKSRKVPIEDAVEDYLATFELVYNFADFITINVSSPNTPQLRELQKPDSLKTLLSNIQRLNQRLSDERSVKRVPLLVKISPDMNSSDLEEIVSIAVEQGCSGLIATKSCRQ